MVFIKICFIVYSKKKKKKGAKREKQACNHFHNDNIKFFHMEKNFYNKVNNPLFELDLEGKTTQS